MLPIIVMLPELSGRSMTCMFPWSGSTGGGPMRAVIKSHMAVKFLYLLVYHEILFQTVVAIYLQGGNPTLHILHISKTIGR